MIGRIYPSWIERTVNSTDAYTGKTFIALLLKASYTFDSTDVFISDLTTASNELSGGNYVRKNPLAGLAVTRVGSVTKVTWSPIVFPLITATGTGAARSMIIAMVPSGGTDSTSPLVLQQDFESAPDATNEDVSITPATTGFIQYTSTP